MSDSNITEKYFMWFADLRKNAKLCQIKSSLNRGYVRRIIQFSESAEAANTDCSNKLHVKKFTACVINWNILNNDLPNQKNDFHQYEEIYATVKYLTHAFQDL